MVVKERRLANARKLWNGLLSAQDIFLELSITRTPFYQLVKDGEFTRPIKRGSRSFWPAYEIESLAEAMIAGLPVEATRALVTKLHDDRNKLLESLL